MPFKIMSDQILILSESRFDIDIQSWYLSGSNLLKAVSLFDVDGGIRTSCVSCGAVTSGTKQPVPATQSMVPQARQFAASNMGSSGLTIHVMHNYFERNLSFIYLVKLLGFKNRAENASVGNKGFWG